MKYFKYIDNDYIIGIFEGSNGEIEITKEEYDTIINIINNKPIAEKGFDYLLKTDLTWEQIEIPIISKEDEEITDTEALEIITGGANDE